MYSSPAYFMTRPSDVSVLLIRLLPWGAITSVVQGPASALEGLLQMPHPEVTESEILGALPSSMF